jgi:hypothetical protein
MRSRARHALALTKAPSLLLYTLTFTPCYDASNKCLSIVYTRICHATPSADVAAAATAAAVSFTRLLLPRAPALVLQLVPLVKDAVVSLRIEHGWDRFVKTLLPATGLHWLHHVHELHLNFFDVSSDDEELYQARASSAATR